MPATADSHIRRLLALITLTVWCLVLEGYQWQSTNSCSSPLLPQHIPGHLAEKTPSRTPSPIVLKWVRHKTVLSLVSKHIIVRSVYFDDRPRDGHQNASVFMVEALRGYVREGLILGCQIGKYFGIYTKVRRLKQMNWVLTIFPYINHDLYMVDCFDLPVRNGSRALLVFKNGLKYVESQRPLFFPASRISHGSDIKVLVCVATLRYTTYSHRLTLYGMLYHWLKYQRVIGVDHVHFIAHPSFLEVGSLQNDVIRKAILDQFLSIEFWEPWLNETDNYYDSQKLAYQDCSYRFRGTYDYIVICDTDEFFVPRIPSKPKYRHYIQKWCPNGACVFKRIERYPDCGLDQEKMTEDGNMTTILKSNKSNNMRNPKSLYNSSMVLEVGTHHPKYSLSGYPITNVPSKTAYFAHIRYGRDVTC